MKFISQVYTYILTIFFTQDKTDTTEDRDISCHQSDIHSFFNTQDKTDATQMEINQFHQSGTHTYTLSLMLKVTPTPWQMEIHHVHQSGTPKDALSLYYS